MVNETILIVGAMYFVGKTYTNKNFSRTSSKRFSDEYKTYEEWFNLTEASHFMLDANHRFEAKEGSVRVNFNTFKDIMLSPDTGKLKAMEDIFSQK